MTFIPILFTPIIRSLLPYFGDLSFGCFLCVACLLFNHHEVASILAVKKMKTLSFIVQRPTMDLLCSAVVTISLVSGDINHQYASKMQFPTDHFRISDYATYSHDQWSSHRDEEWSFLSEEPSWTLADVIATEPKDNLTVVYDLMKRVLGDKSNLADMFSLEYIKPQEQSNGDLPPFLSREKHSDHPVWSKALSLDVMELDNKNNKIILRGSSTIALIVAFNWYLESYCNTTYDWRTYSLDLPETLPLPPHSRNVRSVPFSYYENVCTVSYTQAFWSWTEWETHLDWMAMQGINMPLSFTGQEYIFSKTFARFNFTQSDLQSFFSGPGFFAWQRMGNLRGWAGPITEDCIMDQYNLQLNILARMNSFGMIPALTAFAGHVPYAITEYYPDADTTPSPNWWHSPDEYCCDLLLNFTDPLFTQIGSAFIEEQTKYFGTGHVYQCDTFNEMQPPTDSTTYLASASQYIYDSMKQVDPHAIWLMQGWLFQDTGFWKPAQTKAYLRGIPEDAMIVLDLYSEVSPRYDHYESYYGTPFIWNTLHNFGGNNGLLGTLYNIAVGVPQAKKYPNSTVIGVGITMEGIWQNYIVYDETFKMAFYEDELDVTHFVDRYAIRRYGLPFTVKRNNQDRVLSTLQNAWQQLKSTVYNISHWGGVTKNLMVTSPKLNAVHSGFMPTEILYDPAVIQKVWSMFLSVSDSDISKVEKYRYDLVDITRQALSDRFYSFYQKLNDSYFVGDVDGVRDNGVTMMELMTDLDTLLNTNEYWMLGEWIEMARKHGTNEEDQDWWEFNARNQVTLWGPDGEISNYASKQWGGLIAGYHQPQWKLFIDSVEKAVANNQDFDQSAFVKEYMSKLAQPWQNATDKYPTKPQGDTIKVACELYNKWNTNGDALKQCDMMKEEEEQKKMCWANTLNGWILYDSRECQTNEDCVDLCDCDARCSATKPNGL